MSGWGSEGVRSCAAVFDGLGRGARGRASDDNGVFPLQRPVAEIAEKSGQRASVHRLEHLRQVVRQRGFPISIDLDRIGQERLEAIRALVEDQSVRRVAIQGQKAAPRPLLVWREPTKGERV